jgi:hypothetical protein
MTDATPGASLPGARKRIETETRPTGANPTTNPLSEPVHGFVLPEAIEKYHDGVQLPIHLITPVDITQNPIKYEMAVRTVPGGTPTWVRDAAANNSDKTFTVPAGKIWDIQAILTQLNTTATVGNRYLVVTISNGTALVWTALPTAAIAASKVAVTEVSCGSIGTLTTARPSLITGTAADISVSEGGPRMILPAGFVIRAYDPSAIDPAADDLIVVLHYIEYDA